MWERQSQRAAGGTAESAFSKPELPLGPDLERVKKTPHSTSKTRDSAPHPFSPLSFARMINSLSPS